MLDKFVPDNDYLQSFPKEVVKIPDLIRICYEVHTCLSILKIHDFI